MPRIVQHRASPPGPGPMVDRIGPCARALATVRRRRLQEMIDRVEDVRGQNGDLLLARIAFIGPRHHERPGAFQHIALVLARREHRQQMVPEWLLGHRREHRVAEDPRETACAYLRLVDMRIRLQAQHQLAPVEQIVERPYGFAIEIGIDPAEMTDHEHAGEIGAAHRMPVSVIDRQELGKNLGHEGAIVLVRPESIFIVRVVCAPALLICQPSFGDLLDLPGLVDYPRDSRSA